MAFKLLKSDMMGTSPIEYHSGTAGESFTVGQVLCANAGYLTKGGVDAAGKQQYICAGNVSATEPETKQVPCYRIIPGRLYSTQLTEIGATLKIGDRVTISTDGLGVTATTANGVCEIVYIDGILAGSNVRVRFH